MAGYAGYSMSNNAVAAYGQGKLPASKAAAEFGFKSPASLRACVRPCEWHHTSKEYNLTQFYDVEQAVQDAEWRELAGWRRHMTKRGWERIRLAIRDKMREQLQEHRYVRCRNKGRIMRLMELRDKYPTPYQRRNGLNAVEYLVRDKLLTEANYLAAKAEVDARRNENHD